MKKERRKNYSQINRKTVDNFCVSNEENQFFWLYLASIYSGIFPYYNASLVSIEDTNIVKV